MSFLSSLGNVINEQFGFGEKSVTSLDTADRIGNFGLLGKFANKFDRSAERSYIEDGLISNTRPRMREVLFQQPDVTIIVKKKMFSSLIENSRLDLLEEKEKLFIRASKKLFENKCRLIEAYERLTKIERVSYDSGEFNTHLLPTVLRDVSEFERAGFQLLDPETRAALDTLRQALAFSDSEQYTTWINDYDSAFSGSLGQGTGVIELTNFATLDTNVSTIFGSGNASISIEDPYKILRINQKDIDQAISDAQNFFQNSVLGQFTENELSKVIDDLKARFNTLRLNRLVSPIRFVLSPQTLISKKVRAIVEGEGREIKFEYNSGLVGVGSQVIIDETDIDTGFNSLSSIKVNGSNSYDTEVDLFKQIISNIYLLLGYYNTTKSQIREFNQETNYVRNKMRLMFKGKSIIQTMDIVNVFMTTRTMNDTALTAGFPGYQTTGALKDGQLINNLLRNINVGIADLTGSKSSPDVIEKNAIVGANFPLWLWRMFRNNFTKSGAGTCIFVGLVKTVNQRYEGGKYTVSISCEDNASYFNKSQVNFKPSINVFNSTLYDPLTPFDVSFDAATGSSTTNVTDGELPALLPENQTILSTRSIKFKTTDFKGQNANQILYKTKKNEIVFGKLRRVLADVDGFVYRWKQGVQALTKVERADPSANLQGENPVALTTNPFAGQDVMNVLSLLVTGQPYNFNTFLKSALENGNDITAYDHAQNEDQHSSYIDGLIRELSKRNVIWGNFLPFKSLSVNDEAFAFIRQGQSDLTKRQSNLQSLIRQRASKMDERALQLAGLDPDELSKNDFVKQIDLDILKLDDKIEKEKNLFSLTESELFSSKSSGSIKIVGDDISFEPGFDENDGDNAVSEEQRLLSRVEMRRKVNIMAQRRLWKVKANKDPNLFVVDDQYDKNYDIQAFERKIGAKMSLFDSEYLTIDSQIKAVAEILGLEIFADSQGNIVVRPPLYNRMPSSVFYQMFKERDATGVKVFPDFLESLLFNQLSAVTNRIEIVEDEIRYRAISLGITGSNDKESDRSIIAFIRGGQSPAYGGPTGFVFLSDPTFGKIPGERLQQAALQADPKSREDIENQNISKIEDLNTRALGQSSVQKAFDIVTRVGEVDKRNFVDSITKLSGDYRIQRIRDRLLQNKGVKAKTEDELFSNKRYKSLSGKVSELDAINVVQQIAGFVAERQRLVRDLANITKNLQEGLLINRDDEGGKQALTPFLNRKTSIPSILEHMIEDESFDDLGQGSGNRFVIKENQIVSINISENPPAFTAIQVNGLFGQGFVDPATTLGANFSGASGGNAMVSAYAVDYDMWYQYGFNIQNSVFAPWASDPESQCAPFAVSLLNRARKNIFGGDLVINGYNEFYQAGDVVYIEDYDMLFYVTSVAHSFSYSGSLSTRLTVSYGHNPGEYIPTHLDMVGKYLYNSQTFSEKYRSSRFAVDGDDISLGSVIVRNNGTDLKDILTGPHGKHNRNILNKILYAASGSLNPNFLKNSKPVLEIRIYTSSKSATTLSNTEDAASEIRDYLVSPQKFSTINNIVLGDSELKNNFIINYSDIKIVNIDIDEDIKSPSSSAWNTARLIQANGISGSSGLNDDPFIPNVNFSRDDTRHIRNAPNILDDIMMNNVIDVWVSFDDVQDSIQENSQINQAAQLTNQAVSMAKKAAG